MNFDGKAFVKNTSINFFVSDNGNAFVRNKKEQSVNNLCLTKDNSYALTIPSYNTNKNEINFIKYYRLGFIPYTVQVYGETKQDLDFIRFNIIKDTQIHEEQIFKYNDSKAYVSSIQPTNIKYNPKSAIVYDSSTKESEYIFAGISTNVYSKTEVIIPEKTAEYTNMSLVVQKNSFLEIKIPESVINIINLPEDLIFIPGYIKGTFTKSGEYNIKIKYPDGEQILNIVVPYYQRLL